MTDESPRKQPGHHHPGACAHVTCDERGRFRVRVVRAAGTEVFPGLIAADPAPAQGHFGVEGWCDYDGVPFPDRDPSYTNPRIELDDGGVLWGYEGWWEPLYTEAGKAHVARIRAEMEAAMAAGPPAQPIAEDGR